MPDRLSRNLKFCLPLVILAVYYPAIHAPLNPMDDRAIVNWLFNLDGISLQKILFSTSDYFYRPVLLMTYLADKYLWGAEASFMHLENVLLHTANALLVFSISSALCKSWGHDSRWLPFASALLFGLHPLNAESVNWIAGRSDLLACLFVLLSCRSLLLGLEQNKLLYALLSMLLLVPGTLSKETAAFFIPVALLMIVSFPPGQKRQSSGLIKNIQSRFGFVVLFVAAPLLYLVARIALLSRRDTGLSMAVQFIKSSGNAWDLFQTAFVGTGFYVKKLFIPWPHNFVISQVPDYYFWIGLLVLPIMLYSLCRMDLPAVMFIAAALIGFSALLALIFRPAWTPVAERYMYIPSVFFSIGVSVAVYGQMKRFLSQRFIVAVLVIFFSTTAYATFERNLVWQDNLLLFQDAVRKSPDSPFARSVLADLLREEGEEAEGRNLILTNTAPEGLRNADFLDLKRAQLLIQEGKQREARMLILDKRHKEGQLYHTFIKLLIVADSELLATASGAEREAILSELIASNRELYAAYRDPFYYYRLGQLYLLVPDRASAVTCFKLAEKESPPDSHYKRAAGRLAERLSKP